MVPDVPPCFRGAGDRHFFPISTFLASLPAVPLAKGFLPTFVCVHAWRLRFVADLLSFPWLTFGVIRCGLSATLLIPPIARAVFPRPPPCRPYQREF